MDVQKDRRLTMKKLLLIFILVLVPLCSWAQQCSDDQLARLSPAIVGGSVPVAAGGTETIGFETAGGTETQTGDSYMLCQKLAETPTYAGSVDSVTVTLSSSVNRKTYLSIYTHDADVNEPATLLTNGSSTELDITTSATDVTFTFVTKPTVEAGGQYWVCFSTQATSGHTHRFQEASGGNRVGVLYPCTYGTFPDWAEAGTIIANVFFGKAYFTYSY